MSIESKKLESVLIKATNAVLSSNAEKNGFNRAIKILGEMLRVDRVYINRHYNAEENDEIYFANYCEWTAYIHEKQKSSDLKKISYSGFNQVKLYENLSQGKSLQFKLQKPMEELRTEFPDERAKSILLVPVLIKAGYWGFIGLEEFKFVRHFSEAEVKAIKKLSEVFAFLIEGENESNFSGKSNSVKLNLIDIESINSLSEGDNQGFRFFVELFDIYLKDIPLVCSEIDSAIETKNYTNLKFFSHKLSGSLMHLGVSNTSELCHKLEEAGYNETIDDNVIKLNAKMQNDIKHILVEISFLRKIYSNFI